MNPIESRPSTVTGVSAEALTASVQVTPTVSTPEFPNAGTDADRPDGTHHILFALFFNERI
jgi:hypothetical protein